MSDVLSRLGQSNAKEVVVLLDSCFSGAGGRSVLAAGARPLVRVKEVSAAPTVALLSAATGSEISGPTSSGNAGLFSSYLMQAIGHGMADANGDGQISIQEVSDWVRPRVARDARKDGRDQNPKLVVGGRVSSPSELLLAWGLPAK